MDPKGRPPLCRSGAAIGVLYPLLFACSRDPESGLEEPPDTTVETDVPGDYQGVVVYWTLDTLGARAADEAGFCQAIRDILAEHGRDLACVEGGVSPSSWTAPAHMRLLWPDHTLAPLSARTAPRCDGENALARIARVSGGRYVFGADNATLGPETSWSCDDGRSAFMQGADAAFGEGVTGTGQSWEVTPEADRAVHKALDEVEQRLDDGENLEVFLNSFEVGGHTPPRCADSVDAPGCDAMWQYAVRAGLVGPDDDRRTAWLSRPMLLDLEGSLIETFQQDPLAARAMLWGSMQDAIATTRAVMFEDRLERLLDAVDAAGRQDDLVLVMLGDHGETPGQVPTNGKFNPSHGGQPNEWTALVPVYLSPASLADEWRADGLISADGDWWSTGNLARGLVAHAGVEEPAEWPPIEAPGAATSWACNDFRDPTVGAAGIHLVGNHAARCQNDVCETNTFAWPADLNYLPTPLATTPDDLTAWIGPANPFFRLCAVAPPN